MKIKKIVDISMVLEEDLPSDPEIQIPHIQRRNHKDTAPEMGNYFPGATIDDLPEGNGWAIDFAQLCTHSGTHLDAPWHYYPTMNNGEKAWTIDEVVCRKRRKSRHERQTGRIQTDAGRF